MNTLDIDDFVIQGSFPVFITPQHATAHWDAFIDKIDKNKSQLQQLLLKQGALLFRDFPVTSADHFSTFIERLNFGNFVNYIGGDSPRDKVINKVYTSTEAPPSLHIPLHQELSFIKKFPKHIYFYCDIAPVQGGSTIIADARRIYQAIDTEVRKRFQKKSLTYISHYHYQSKIMDWVNRMQRSHKSWCEVFETHSKLEVEKLCLENEFAWQWLPRDWIQIKQTRPAILEHPETDEPVWFNQAHLYDFNPRLLGWKRYLGAKLFYCRPSTKLHEIEFSDGDQVPRKDLYHILDVLNKNTVTFPWQKGDVLVLDNILAMHGRAPFKGKRRVLTALTA